ncbi:MAG: 4-alpha-glucanotransferase [Planctomycetaceae bacterium]
MMMSPLQQLAEMCGVLTSFEDVFGRRQNASEESLLAVLHALGVEIGSLDDVPQLLEHRRLSQLEQIIEPVIISWEGNGLRFDLTLPLRSSANAAECTIEWEDQSRRCDCPARVEDCIDLTPLAQCLSPCGRFVSRRLELPIQLPYGYHRLTLEVAGAPSSEALIISAPNRAYTGNASRRDWGCFLPLYALKSERNWGAGDFTDLKNLAKWMSNRGGSVLGTLPMLAAFLDQPYEPSPYAPCSRLAWNEFYVDVADVPELADSPRASELMHSSAVIDPAFQLRGSSWVDYRHVMALKRRVLEILADEFFEQKPAQRFAQFEQFIKQHRHIEDYAAYRATYERRKEPWQNWPDRLRGGTLTADDYDEQNKRYHLYAQWIATTQLESLADSAGGGLYLDLPLGVRPDGYDVWRWRDCYANGASAGSPPELMWTNGQNWGFPPLHPQKIREDGYRHVRDYLSHHLRLARLLRIDHVMQLHRLYWIPDNMEAGQGVYVRYRPDEFYALLCLESHRCQTMLIGENLGTVSPAVNEAMERHNIRQMYVVQYETASVSAAAESGSAAVSSSKRKNEGDDVATVSPSVLRHVPAGSLASLNTHDMPMFAAWWRGEDITMRQKIGLISQDQVQDERDDLESKKERLTNWLHEQGWLKAHASADEVSILTAILAYLAASDAGVVLVNLEDLWLETEPQNIPGTGHELPNWRRKGSEAFETFANDPYVQQTLREIDMLRKKQ